MTVIQPGFADVSMEFRHTLMSRSAYITFGVDPTSADPIAIATAVAAAYTAAGSLRTLVDTDTVLRDITVRLGQDGAPPLVGTNQPNSTGQAAGQTSLPPNCAVLVHKKTALGGRRYRGRLFLPWCIGEGSVDESGVIGSSNVTAMTAALEVWRAALASGTNPMVILHSTGISPVPTATPVTSLQADPLISTQRRRLPR